MQYLKEDVKIEIMKAALKEFNLYGFEKASMKNISRNAGVATGNIYRYFKNKEQLFNELIEPAHSHITALVFNKFLTSISNMKIHFNPIDIVNSIMEVYLSYSTELMIMMYKSEGTKYENTKEDLLKLVHKRLKYEYMSMLNKQGIDNVETFIYVFSSVLIDGMFIIFGSDGDTEEKSKLINQLLIFYFNNLDERFS